jgi:hypothetical protein
MKIKIPSGMISDGLLGKKEKRGGVKYHQITTAEKAVASMPALLPPIIEVKKTAGREK